MQEKVILITGSTDGIGKVTANALAILGHTIIVHGRNQEKAEAVCQELKSKTGNGKIDFVVADLLSLSDVKRMAEGFKTKYGQLDVLINNAGAMFGKDRQTSKDGFEKTMALNLFAPFLLTQLLLETLGKSPSARIINVTSAAHSMTGELDLNDIQQENNYSFGAAYGQSKLYLIWITQHLAIKLKENGYNYITANSVHPGMIASEFGKNADKGLLTNLFLKFLRPFAKTPQQGAETILYLATSKDVYNVSGKYFANSKVKQPNEKYYSLHNEKKVWDYCAQVTKPFVEQQI